MKGNVIDILINQELMQGTHNISWVSKAHSSGIYFARFISTDLIETKKLLLLK